MKVLLKCKKQVFWPLWCSGCSAVVKQHRDNCREGRIQMAPNQELVLSPLPGWVGGGPSTAALNRNPSFSPSPSSVAPLRHFASIREPCFREERCGRFPSPISLSKTSHRQGLASKSSPHQGCLTGTTLCCHLLSSSR